MSEEKDVLGVDVLFKGLTRPPMLAGVSYSFMMLNFFVTVISFIITTKLWIFILGFVIHGIGYIICRDEPLFLELILLKMQKFNNCKNKIFHRGNSYDVN
jgi:type IV secretion system protein VirB3